MRHNNRLYQNSAKLTATNNNINNNKDNINNINNSYNNNIVENLSFSSTESLTDASVKEEEEIVVVDYPSAVI